MHKSCKDCPEGEAVSKTPVVTWLLQLLESQRESDKRLFSPTLLHSGCLPDHLPFA